jgi:hypothetical protein
LNDSTITQKLLPTKVLPENGRVILDSEKFSSLRKSTQFSKSLILAQEKSLIVAQEKSVIQPQEEEDDRKPVYSSDYSEPMSTILNNSTLINLSFDDNFQQQTLLDFAAIK